MSRRLSLSSVVPVNPMCGSPPVLAFECQLASDATSCVWIQRRRRLCSPNQLGSVHNFLKYTQGRSIASRAHRISQRFLSALMLQPRSTYVHCTMPAVRTGLLRSIAIIGPKELKHIDLNKKTKPPKTTSTKYTMTVRKKGYDKDKGSLPAIEGLIIEAVCYWSTSHYQHLTCE